MKWVKLVAGNVTDFTTCMTSEQIALLSGSSVLRHSVSADGWDNAAFKRAVKVAVEAPENVARCLFELLAESMLHGLSGQAARARLSGYLIGQELAATHGYWHGAEVCLIGEEALSNTYLQALGTLKSSGWVQDAERLTLSGLRAAFQTIGETQK